MGLFSFDAAAAAAAHRLFLAGGPFLTALMRLITTAGNGGAVFLALSLVLLIPRHTRRRGLLMLLSLAVSALLANVLLKNVFARERPFADPLSPFYTYWREAGSLAASGFSFPSGHTAAAAAFAAAIVVTSRRSIAWTAFFLPLVMGLSRVYFGVHYASDVLAAIPVGLLGCLAALPLHAAACRLAFFSPLPPREALGQNVRQRMRTKSA